MDSCQASVPPNTPQRWRLSAKRYLLISAGVGLGLLLTHNLRASITAAAFSTNAAVMSVAKLERVARFMAGATQTSGDRAEYLPSVTAALVAKGSSAANLPASCPVPQTVESWGNLFGNSAHAHLSRWSSKLGSSKLGSSELNASSPSISWPNIHPQARLASVPVIMYHDVLPEKEIFFDITIEELENDFHLIEEQGLTPISFDQLVAHLKTGAPLPAKPIMLTFDDGYAGHYDVVFELLKRYQYPAAFSVFTGKLDGDIVGRSTLTWQQLKAMAASPLVTIVSHSVSHPSDLRQLTDDDLRYELTVSKQQLEEKLGKPIRYFTYPEGNHDERVVEATAAAGYQAALIMDNVEGQFAGTSENLLMLERFGESRLEEVIETAWGGPPQPGAVPPALDMTRPIVRSQIEVDDIPLTLISGGQIQTIHADSRYLLVDMVADTEVVAAVDGTFFSLEYLDSNTMIGPVLSQNTGKFIPGSPGDIDKLKDRPLVLVGPQSLQFIAFDPAKHNTLAGIQQEMPDVSDAFVGAAWLVHRQEAQPKETFKNLFAFEESRFRAFWGIDQQGRPVVGATQAQVDSVGLGERLVQAGFQEAVMLDSGQSTSLVYKGESQMIFEPRTVPHAVALVPSSCQLRSR